MYIQINLIIHVIEEWFNITQNIYYKYIQVKILNNIALL